MPQITRLRRVPLDNRMMNIEKKSDMAYLFTSQIVIPAWRENANWETVSKLHRRLVQTPDLMGLKHLVRGAPFDDEEVLNQAALAFQEFYRRVVVNYQDDNARMNGDVYAGLQFSKSAQLTGGKK